MTSTLPTSATSFSQHNVDQGLPTFKDGDDIVRWWASVFETGRCSKALSHSPHCSYRSEQRTSVFSTVSQNAP
ncbi:hypothetical protein MHYP_G00190460 [Metynnis hypsauchen]